MEAQVTIFDAQPFGLDFHRFDLALYVGAQADLLPPFTTAIALCDRIGRLNEFVTVQSDDDFGAPALVAILGEILSAASTATAAIVYARGPVSLEPPERQLGEFRVLRAAFRSAGITLVDWIILGDEQLRSMAFTEGVPVSWWPDLSGRETPDPGSLR